MSYACIRNYKNKRIIIEREVLGDRCVERMKGEWLTDKAGRKRRRPDWAEPLV